MKTGLTPFLSALMRTPRDSLVRANTAKLAAKYGIPEDWARYYLNDWMRR
ncbi:hypothetical protein [Sphingomonas sp. PB4P5]